MLMSISGGRGDDLMDPSGPAQVQLHHTSALEWLARDT
jgi:hypothetical protein